MSAGAHKSSPSQVPTILLTTVLIVLWLSLQRGDPYTNCLLKDTAIFLCIDGGGKGNLDLFCRREM